MKLFAILANRFFGLERSSGTILARCETISRDWLRDPLAHPQIASMDLALLADLPSGQLRSATRE